MVKCLNKEDGIPFREIKRCKNCIGDGFVYFYACLISGNKISRSEHKCKFYEE